MAVELTDEEKTKFQEHLKELGFDEHAQKTIQRLNSEAKSNRERAEEEARLRKEAEEKAKTYETEAQRKAREAEEARLAEENAKKSVDDRLKAIEEKFTLELSKRDEKNAQIQKEYLDDLKARDAQILMQTVRAAAKDRGIIDEELVALIDVSGIPVEKGIVDRDKVIELIDKHAEAKPALYRSVEERPRNDRGQFERPNPRDPKKSVDAGKLADEEFEAMEQRLRQGRV